MQRREFGRTGVKVSSISLGCWLFGVDWWGHYTQDDCDRLCSFSKDLGISFFDNGDAYGNGRAETLFGQWMKNAKVDRSSVEIGSKFGYDIYADPGTPGSHRERTQNFSASFMRTALEKSLERLGTDYVDVYMAHNIKLPQFNDELFAELEKVKDEGKIRTWGVSLGPAIGWRDEGFKAMLDHGAKAVQTVYNLFEQHPGREFCETARATHAGILARVQDNSGILKDNVKIETEFKENDHRKFRDQAWKIYGVKKLEFVRPIAQKHGMTMHQLACKWLLSDPQLTAITATLLNEAEIRDAVEAVDKPDLTQQDLIDLANGYAVDWDLGPEAHPCDIKSSIDPSGKQRSTYVAPPVLIA